MSLAYDGPGPYDEDDSYDGSAASPAAELFPVLLELAFGADPAGDPSLWVWTPVPALKVLDQDISIRRGRSDESATATPASATFTVDNPDGAYTPDDRRSLHWPHVRRGTPARFWAARDDVWTVRFCGQVSEWVPSWPRGDISDHDDPDAHPGEARVDLVCNGILRRLGQGARVLESPLHRLFSAASNVIAYWPIEDGAVTDHAGSPIRRVRPLRVTGPVEWGSDDTLPGSKNLPRVPVDTEAALVGPVPSHDPGGSWTVHVLVKAPTNGSGTDQVEPLRIWTSGTFRVMNVSIHRDGVETSWRQRDGGPTVTHSIDTGRLRGWYRLSVSAVEDPVEETTTWDIIVVPAGQPASAALAGSTFSADDVMGRVTAAGMRARDAKGELTAGHLVVETGHHAWDPSADHGYEAETAAARMVRLCDEEDVDLVVDGDTTDSTPMGPQRPATLLELLNQCAASEEGILAEQIAQPGLVFRTRAGRYNQAPDLVLDATANEIDEPFAPTLDDQRLRNDVTVTREGGASAQSIDDTSIFGDDDRAGEGRYDEQITLSLAADRQAAHHAAWRLHAGTWPGMRYPAVAGSLPTAPDGWLDLVEGDRVQVTGLPPQHPTAAVDVIVEGLTETITPVAWKIEAACSPAGIWDVSTLDTDHDDPDLELDRLDSDDTFLAAPVDSDDTALTVDVFGLPWDTDADLFPFAIVVDGEPMTVTSIAGSTTPQTFTVVRDTEAPAAHALKAEVHAAAPLTLAL